MHQIIKLVRRDLLSYLLVIILAIIAGRFLLTPGYFNIHDDLQMMRQLAIEECFRDLQIPCRWTPHMGYGFGFPLFNYYPSLPYLVGEIFRVVGFSFVETVKLTFLLSFILSGLTMYILAREFWGKLGGLLSSLFYIWAPYHALDIYVRGAMNEAWALVWFPLVLWSSYKFIKKGNKFSFFLTISLSWFALFNSHNLMAMIFAPLFGIWTLFWIYQEKAWNKIPKLILSGIWALGLSAFFTLPVFLEQKFVQVETLVVGYYEYIAHYADTNQLLFSRFWGYGASSWLSDDKMSFQIGHIHWVITLIILVLVALKIRKKKKIETLDMVIIGFIVAGWFAAFMVHSRSTPIWQIFDKFLKFVQFPWRFLTLVILCFSFATGSLMYLLGKYKNFLKFILLLTFSILLIIFNKDFFKPEKMGPLTDEEKFSGAAWDLQQTAGIYDYLPKGAKTAPKEPQKTLGEILVGEGEVYDQTQKTNFAEFKVKVVSDTAKVRINIFEYPGWKIFLDGQEITTYIGDDDWGRMHTDIQQGEHTVTAKLFNTPARTAGNTISLISWAALLTLPMWKKKLIKG